MRDAVRKMRDQRAAKIEDKTDEQTKEGRNIKGPTTETVDGPSVPAMPADRRRDGLEERRERASTGRTAR